MKKRLTEIPHTPEGVLMRLKEKITVLQDKFMVRVDQAMGISVGLVKF